MTEVSAVVEKPLRSVFVGNIPYEATEEKLREIFSQAGPVVSFKLMYDRETGNPKGYGFCEYKDQETALSAMRNINGYEIGGRPLRVDNACTEKSRMEMQSLMLGPIVESPYGTDVDPDKAPEAISNAVASLPPEQMYELMRQMKVCVRNNPAEARTLLMTNPQLAYALLQAQVVMRIIDPKTAIQILHGPNENVEPLLPTGVPNTGSVDQSGKTPSWSNLNGGPQPTQNAPTNMPNQFNTPQNAGPRPNIPQAPPPIRHPPGPVPSPRFPQGPPSRPPPQAQPFPGPPHNQSQGPPPQAAQLQQGPPSHIAPQGGTMHPNQGPRPVHHPGDFDLRDMSGPRPPMGSDQDMRRPPRGVPPPHENFQPKQQDFDSRFGRDFDLRDPRFRDGPNQVDRDFRENTQDTRDNRDRDPRGARDPRAMERDRDYRGGPPPTEMRDPRGRNFSSHDKDFRAGPPLPPANSSGTPSQPSIRTQNIPMPSSLPPNLANQDQEKANLIMQVLQLSDEQIRMLPTEQQASILQLKQQLQRTSQ